VNEAALVKLAESRGNRDSDAQEEADLHGRAKPRLERLATRIFEHHHGPAALSNQLERTHRPRPVETSFSPYS
jgi:hypothetical protein